MKIFFSGIFPGTYARVHKYILQDILQRPKKSPFFPFTLFKKLFFKNRLVIGRKVLTLHPKAERNDRNENRELCANELNELAHGNDI